MDLHKKIVILGGAAAGVEAARAIAERGRGGETLLISAEPRLPYKRTKVSKSFARGFERDAFALQDEGWWRQQGFDLRLGLRATRVEPAARAVELEDGTVVGFDRLVLATGARANELPLPPEVTARVHHAHNIQQVEALRAAASAGSVHRALVIGMGAMGVEVAEQLARMGKQVTLAGDTAAPLAEELDDEGQRMLLRTLEQNGVTVRPGLTVSRVAPDGAGLQVHFGDSGGSERCDLAAFCIGTRVNVELAREAGLTVDRGVVVDAQLRASHPGILAAGDMAQHPDGRVTYLWRHAMEQGRVAGLNAMGSDETYAYRPFRLKVKLFGDYFFALDRPAPEQEADFEVVRSWAGDGYLCGYYRDDRLRGLVMVNDPDNQKRYNLAVVEGWDREKFEAEFG